MIYCFVTATYGACTRTSTSNGLPSLERTQANYFYMLSNYWPTQNTKKLNWKLSHTGSLFHRDSSLCITPDQSFVLTRLMMKIQPLAGNEAEGAGSSSVETASQTPPGRLSQGFYQKRGDAARMSQGFSYPGQRGGRSNCLNPEQRKEAPPATQRLLQAAWRVFSTPQLFSTAQLRSSLLNAFSQHLHQRKEAMQHNLLCSFSQCKPLHSPFRKGRGKSKGHILHN